MITLTISAILLSILLYVLFENRKTINRLQSEIETINNSYIATQLDGIFEVHITIDPEDNYVKLLNYIKNHEDSKNMKLVFAASFAKNNQYMLSYFTRRDDDRLVVDGAIKIHDELTGDNIKVSRVKIEGHGVKGTPMTTNEYQKVKKYLEEKYNNKCGVPYFEFHVKISSKKNGPLCYSELENEIKNYENVGISYNLCGSDKKPLLTIRRYGDGFVNAQKHKDFIMNDMKNKGYFFEDKIQQEFSIYDSFPEMDNGWLSIEP